MDKLLLIVSKRGPLLLALAQKIWVTHAEVYYCKCSNTIRTIHTVCIVYYCILPISAEFFKYCILLCTHIKAASNSDMYTISVKSTGLPNKCMVVRSSSSEPGLRSRGGCPWNKAVWAGLTDQACCKTSCCWILLRRCYENVSERESDTLLFFSVQRCHRCHRVVITWNMIIREIVASKKSHDKSLSISLTLS